MYFDELISTYFYMQSQYFIGNAILIKYHFIFPMYCKDGALQALPYNTPNILECEAVFQLTQH